MATIHCLEILERKDKESLVIFRFALPDLPFKSKLIDRDDFNLTLGKANIHKITKECIRNRVEFALDLFYPKNFYRFNTMEWSDIYFEINN